MSHYLFDSHVPSSLPDRRCFQKDRSGNAQSSRHVAGTACYTWCRSSSRRTWCGRGTPDGLWRQDGQWPAMGPQGLPCLCEHVAQSAAPHLKSQRWWFRTADKLCSNNIIQMELNALNGIKCFSPLYPPPQQLSTDRSKDTTHTCTHAHTQSTNKTDHYVRQL